MRQTTDEHSHLAGAFLARPADPQRARLAAAFLALADDPAPAPAQRSARRALCALAAGVVLAFAAPLAWASPAPRDQPAATAAGKAAGVEIDDDAEGPWPDA
jgi:ferric-dicitrate binding protein FerR (iron transport regulator)